MKVNLEGSASGDERRTGQAAWQCCLPVFCPLSITKKG